jgi:probable rRNA maturation factor
VLGNKYDVSVVFCGEKLSQRLNRTYRKKNKPTNVLSFPLSKHEGEIFLNLIRIKKEAQKKGLPWAGYLSYLFIHGLLHLKGHDHGSRMEAEEKRILKLFGFFKDRRLAQFFSA